MISLQTQRLLLRPFLETDLQNLIDLDTDPEVMRYIGTGKLSTIDELRELIPKLLKRQESWADYGTWMADLPNGDNIGWFTLKPLPQLNNDFEIGYRLKRKFWGQGYATEGSQFLVQHGFEKINLKKIIGITDPLNLPSQSVLKKCGLIYKGLIPNPFDNETGSCSLFEKHFDWPSKNSN